uniref:Secreted protein n=1 Tax=Anguilla anguilla TaxID=7936 RepID=A0A0E9RGE1_ANGAN
MSLSLLWVLIRLAKMTHFPLVWSSSVISMNYPQSFECVFVACPLVQGGATDHELENPISTSQENAAVWSKESPHLCFF